jgi:hypothetical protein
MVFSYKLLHGDGPIFPEEKEASKHPMVVVLYGTYPREMYVGDGGGKGDKGGRMGTAGRLTHLAGPIISPARQRERYSCLTLNFFDSLVM